MSRPKCYNCGKKGCFARDCKELKKVNKLSLVVSAINVVSFMLLIESYPLWTVDSGATDHKAKDRSAFVEFRQILKGTKWIYVGNNYRVEVKGISTCKLVMISDQTLLLHDVLFAPNIC